MIESADPTSEAHAVSAAHKEALIAYIAGLLRTNGYPEILAASLVLLMDGATVTALRVRSAEPARQAREQAAALLAPQLTR